MLVFPETGVITRDVAADAILAENAEGRRWAEVDFQRVRSVQLTEDVALLTYRVTVPALTSSIYVKREGASKLPFHQQSPLGAW